LLADFVSANPSVIERFEADAKHSLDKQTPVGQSFRRAAKSRIQLTLP